MTKAVKSILHPSALNQANNLTDFSFYLYWRS